MYVDALQQVGVTTEDWTGLDWNFSELDLNVGFSE